MIVLIPTAVFSAALRGPETKAPESEAKEETAR